MGHPGPMKKWTVVDMSMGWCPYGARVASFSSVSELVHRCFSLWLPTTLSWGTQGQAVHVVPC